MGMEYLNFGLNKQKTFDLMNHADLYFPDFPELEKSANATFALLVDGMLNLMPNLSEDELKSLINNNQIAITYCNENGKEADVYNPNGALSNIAGIFNKNKNVLGMMPHPERMIDSFMGGEDGSLFFKDLISKNV